MNSSAREYLSKALEYKETQRMPGDYADEQVFTIQAITRGIIRWNNENPSMRFQKYWEPNEERILGILRRNFEQLGQSSQILENPYMSNLRIIQQAQNSMREAMDDIDYYMRLNERMYPMNSAQRQALMDEHFSINLTPTMEPLNIRNAMEPLNIRNTEVPLNNHWYTLAPLNLGPTMENTLAPLNFGNTTTPVNMGPMEANMGLLESLRPQALNMERPLRRFFNASSDPSRRLEYDGRSGQGVTRLRKAKTKRKSKRKSKRKKNKGDAL